MLYTKESRAILTRLCKLAKRMEVFCMLKGIAASAGAAVAQLFYLEEPDLSVVEETGLDPAQ